MKHKCLYCYQSLDSTGDFHDKCAKQFFGTSEAPILNHSLKEMSELAKQVVERSVAVPGVQPKLKIWLIKVGPDGCLTPGCNDSLVYISTNEALNLKQELLQLTPNLANQNITAIWKDAYTEANHLIIRNIEGSLLKDIVVTLSLLFNIIQDEFSKIVDVL